MNRVHATLFVDDQVLSTGQAELEVPCMFFPDFPETLSTIPNRPLSLKVADTGQTIHITDLKKCEKPLLSIHWHFRICS